MQESGSGVSPLFGKAESRQSRDGSATMESGHPLNYFDPEAPVAFLSGDLPHWRQQGTTYFVTFRLADSLPQELLLRWQAERAKWLEEHPEPHDEAARPDYHDRFPQRLQHWLDAGHGSCVLSLQEVKKLVEDSLRHFDGQRYQLHEFVVATNHVHALVSPLGDHSLSGVLHSWKSFTAHEILKVEAALSRLTVAKRALKCSTTARIGSEVSPLRVWQKESFDHIVRSALSMERFRDYIRNHAAAR